MGKIDLSKVVNVESFDKLKQIGDSLKEANKIVNASIKSTTTRINNLNKALNENNGTISTFLNEINKAGANLQEISKKTNELINSNKSLKKQI